MFDDHSSASGLSARRTSADLSISHSVIARRGHHLGIAEVGERLRERCEVLDGDGDRLRLAFTVQCPPQVFAARQTDAWALASMAARTSSGTSRIKMSVMRTSGDIR